MATHTLFLARRGHSGIADIAAATAYSVAFLWCIRRVADVVLSRVRTPSRVAARSAVTTMALIAAGGLWTVVSAFTQGDENHGGIWVFYIGLFLPATGGIYWTLRDRAAGERVA